MRSSFLVRRTLGCGLMLATAPSLLLAQSMPAPTPATGTPSMPAPSQEQERPVPPYQDPLQKPIPAPNTVSVRQVPDPAAATALPAYMPYDGLPPKDSLGSTYIPVDSVVYPMALRLYSLGYLNTAFLNMRPWTRRSLLHMLEETQPSVMASGDDEAISLLAKLQHEIQAEPDVTAAQPRGSLYGVETVYTRLLGIHNQSLRDSYHLGQTINNDYGRPYEPGFNNITGFSALAESGRFSLYVRGEYQHSPASVGYSQSLANTLSILDTIGPYAPPNAPQATIPAGTLPASNPFRLQEAALSFHLLGMEFSGGKTDAWLGPGYGGAMAWTNNAEDIYSFRFNRVEPLHIPYFSALFGPMRYDFFVGSLKGHTAPNSPWVHSEMVSLEPTSNFQFGFQRTVVWGGKDHSPITLHTFFHSFFNLDDVSGSQKVSRDDPGARFSVFNFSYRLPFVRKYLTLYADSIVHDDVTPPSAPRRAAYRPGLYLSQFPGLHKLDLRVEAASTDTSTLRSLGGEFNYFEIIQKQAYTNKGFIMGDWIGREAKGGQAWLTYHLSGNEWIQLQYLNKKTTKDFIAGGTTQNQFIVDVVKRIRPDVELNAWVQYERWKAPIYIAPTNSSPNSDTTISFQVTWHPQLRNQPGFFKR